MSHAVCVRVRTFISPLTVEQHNWPLERQRMSDLHLAVRPLQHARRQEEHEGRRLLDALEHTLLGQVVGAVVVLQGAQSARKAQKGKQ